MFHATLLQRYMPSDRALKIITDEGLYFRRIDSYPEDTTEGDRESFGRQEQQIFAAQNARLPEQMRMTPDDASQLASEHIHKEKQGIFIQSWFSHQEMSRHMWDAYGGLSTNTDCALIIVDRIKLGEYLDSVLPVGCRMKHVKYVPNKNAQRDGVFTKKERFHSEKEYRISIDLGELIFHNSKILPDFVWPLRPADAPRSEDLGQNYRNNGVAHEDIFRFVSNEGFVLKVPLPRLVEAVYVPTTASEDFCAKFDALLAAQGFEIRCERIEVP